MNNSIINQLNTTINDKVVYIIGTFEETKTNIKHRINIFYNSLFASDTDENREEVISNNYDPIEIDEKPKVINFLNLFNKN